MQKQIAILGYALGFLFLGIIISVLPEQTSMQVFAAGETPTPIATQTITPTQYGPFILTRQLYGVGQHADVGFHMPTWINVSGDEQVDLSRVKTAYDKVTEFNRDTFGDDWNKFTNIVDAFLRVYPESDGAIPVLVMHAHANASANPDLPPNLRWHGYEQAIQLLVERHPERISHILDDLIDMGIQVTQAQYTDLGIPGQQVLLFAVETSGFPIMASLDSFVYSLIREPNRTWRFEPVSVADDSFGGDYSTIQIDVVADINHDGNDEVVISKHLTYASHTDLLIQIFSWDSGNWHKISELGQYYNSNSYWLENFEKDGIGNIVVTFDAGPGTHYPAINYWQWDLKSKTYTATLPIKTQVCGYHAFAEAERRRYANDLTGAIIYYNQAQTLWQKEIKNRPEQCRQFKPYEYYITYIGEIRNELEDAVSGKNISAGKFKFYTYSPLYQYTYSETITQGGTITQEVEKENIFLCDLQPCQLVGIVYQSISYSLKTPEGKYFDCRTIYYNNDDSPAQVQYTSRSQLSQIMHWECNVTDKNITKVFRQNGPDIQTVCTWNRDHFVLTATQIIKPTEITQGDVKDYPTIENITKILGQLADCSGTN